MQTTREIILTELKRVGACRADDLAEKLELTPMAIRQHLYQLRDEGAVVCCAKPQGRGRPAKMWELTEKADVYFPDAHRDLSLDLIDSMKDLFGPEGLERLVDHRTLKQKSRYEASFAGKATLQDRLKALAKERANEGYMAEAVEKDGTLFLLENHCPICEAAKACSGLCGKELSLFKELLADEAEVERTEHLLSGGKRCAYKITPKR
ncbi:MULTISPECIES: helix-turn-helix transcriptional regulator [Kordiimonas]|jgi:predicted ArsR family transcriptional regulator|uniref:helix-turn-helix transcriptional regulator n=1 Tax=Kordiimonas TaxID=288021 RepID=UPI0025805AF3|nr:metalloregulator ArsR/SmtB family transcription factor [Kordiimonas sp. UBA4487]